MIRRGRSRVFGLAVIISVVGVRDHLGFASRPGGIGADSRRQDPFDSAFFQFDQDVLASFGLRFDPRGSFEKGHSAAKFAVSFSPASTYHQILQGATGRGLGVCRIVGAINAAGPGREWTLGDISLESTSEGGWVMLSFLPDPESPFIAFHLANSQVDVSLLPSRVWAEGELLLSDELALRLGVPEAAGVRIGSFSASGRFAQANEALIDGFDSRAEPTGDEVTVATSVGADVIVGAIYETLRWGTSGGISAYSIGTISCNIGTAPAEWISFTNRHPVIAQNLFRLKNGRFEQIGMSWVKHGFLAVGGTLCSGPGGCTVDPEGDYLGVGCSDPYNASLNGGTNLLSPMRLGPRYEVNPSSGYFPYPFVERLPPCGGLLCRRIQVKNEDLEPTLNFGARYFAEAQYITPDDAESGNGLNNASYRAVTISEPVEGEYQLLLSPAAQTRMGSVAIQAWRDSDALVRIVSINVPNDGRFFVGYKVSGLGQGRWHYEYAVQNLHSDRAGGSFAVPLPMGAELFNISFHDIDDHSGSPHSDADWISSDEVGPGARRLTWSTEPYAVNELANSLRWSTLYNFRFDCNAPPTPGEVRLGLFKPGAVAELAASTNVPGGPMEVLSSDPPDGAVDARQPAQLDGTQATGWSRVALDLNVLIIGTGASDFSLTQFGGIFPPPAIGVAQPVDDDSLTLHFQSPISIGGWTLLAHRWSEAAVEIGYLPGDADGNGTSNPADVLALVSSLDHQGIGFPEWSKDMDRSNGFNPADLMRLIDLLNGADAYNPYNGVSLPTR